MRHPSAAGSWFTFDTPAESGFRVFAFSGTEQTHTPCEYGIELVHESYRIGFTALLDQPSCLLVADKALK